MKLRQLLEKLSVEVEENEEYIEYHFIDEDGNDIGHISVEEMTNDYIEEYYFTDDGYEDENVKEYIENLSSSFIYNIQKVFVEKDYRGNHYGLKMLKMVVKPNKQYILNASPEYDTSLSQITKMYKSVGFEELFDQGVNIIMVKN
jgi:predicted GNAT family N-acyltransferase